MEGGERYESVFDAFGFDALSECYGAGLLLVISRYLTKNGHNS